MSPSVAQFVPYRLPVALGLFGLRVVADFGKDVAQRCTVLISMVPDSPDVEKVYLGPDGVLEGVSAGTLLIDTSSISPVTAVKVAQAAEAKGCQMLDAPVSGGDVGAKNATLSIMVGGDADTFARAKPILEIMGTPVLCGDSGAGQTVKACNQILCAVNMIAVCEALTLAQRSGLELTQAIEALSSGAGGSWALVNLGPKIVAGDLAPAFMIELIQKDLRIVQAAAQTLRVALPGTALAQQLFRAVEAEEGGGKLGTQAMVRAIE